MAKLGLTLSEADREFFHKWLHDATQDAEEDPEEDDPAIRGDARALRVGSFLLGFYDGITKQRKRKR